MGISGNYPGCFFNNFKKFEEKTLIARAEEGVDVLNKHLLALNWSEICKQLCFSELAEESIREKMSNTSKERFRQLIADLKLAYEIEEEQLRAEFCLNNGLVDELEDVLSRF